MQPSAPRRLLVVLASLTLAILLADLAGWAGADRVRDVGGLVLGPVQRALSGAPHDELARVEAENVRLRTLTADQQHRLDELGRVEELLGSASTVGRRVIPARVVATDLSPLGGRSVTIDVGSRDGIRTDSTVVAADGLVGRVVAVSPWTSDVQVLGSADSVVAVRVGPAGALGTVSAPAPGDSESRPRGSLRLELVVPSAPVVGDLVRTLGSIDDTPYAAGLVVGTVTAVDPDRGQQTRSATVRPAIDPDAIDVVAVLVPTARTAPRQATPARGSGR
ncbi:rod shape-determining protein MreC [Terrabacter aerolatus]|uniref:Cell shape-determining protein MreC n=1 Tax=Terrabacter aerolatus TaxID=422442 RepID=A0A512D2S3_9MICO|nr:rod shape-determining protein MreC [Terrabacter aerolatus]GEO30743.1 rod shape-determining protein MreC [Terrabacter aerolatus]